MKLNENEIIRLRDGRQAQVIGDRIYVLSCPVCRGIGGGVSHRDCGVFVSRLKDYDESGQHASLSGLDVVERNTVLDGTVPAYKDPLHPVVNRD